MSGGEQPIRVNLAHLRRAGRRTRAQLTEQLQAVGVDVDESTVALWETERAPIPAEYRAEIAGFFGVSVAHLLGHDYPLPLDGNGGSGSRRVA